MEITRTAWAAAVEAVLAQTTVEVVRTEAPGVDRLSPAARERNGFADLPLAKVSFSLVVLVCDGIRLNDFDEIADAMLVSPVRKAVETFKLSQAGLVLRKILTDSYWDAVDGHGGVSEVVVRAL